MQSLLSKQYLKYVLPLFIVLGVILYATGFAGRFYSRLQNALIRTGVVTPGRAEASDFERIELDPESLYMMTLTDLQGEELTLGDFKEDIVLINFWASWCPPCIAEMPGLNQLYEKKKQEIGFLMITWDKDQVDIVAEVEVNASSKAKAEEKLATGAVPKKVIDDCLTALRNQIGREGMKVLRSRRGENSFVVDVKVEGAANPWRCFHDGTKCTGTEYQGEG